MTWKNVATGLLALVGGVIGGALSGGVFGVARPAEASPPPGNGAPNGAPNGSGNGLPNGAPNGMPNGTLAGNGGAGGTTGVSIEQVPAVVTVPAAGLWFKTSGGKVLARLQAHEGGALLSVYNAYGNVVASIGSDASTKGGRLSLATPAGGGCLIGLGVAGVGGRLDLYHPQEATPRATLGVNSLHAGYLTLRDLRSTDAQLTLSDILKGPGMDAGEQIKQK
jgi:hypothetical protein